VYQSGWTSGPARALLVDAKTRRQPANLTLAVLMRPFAVGWRKQIETLSRQSQPDEDRIHCPRLE
jgi:hypothetical protein